MRKSIFVLIMFFSTILFSQDIEDFGPCSENCANDIQYENSTVTIKVLFVEFSDIKHHLPAYENTDFTNLLFSEGVYVSPNMYSPDGEQVFGSLRDYYNIMSNGNLCITGYILNQSSSDDFPIWLTLSGTKSSYNEGSFDTFYNEVILQANSSGISIGNLDQNNVLCIIYAGHAYRRKLNNSDDAQLRPRFDRTKNCYTNSEQFAPGLPYNDEHKYRTFGHIGTHAHEFGHFLGLMDHNVHSVNWDLMGQGNFNGPVVKGACPAPMSPLDRNRKGWLDFTSVNNSLSINTSYSLQAPTIYKIAPTTTTAYFLDFRIFNSTMVIGTTICYDYNHYTPHGVQNNGSIIWYKDGSGSYYIVHADGKIFANNWFDKSGILYPGERGVKVLSHWSDYRNTQEWFPVIYNSTAYAIEVLESYSNYQLIHFFVNNAINSSPTYPKNPQVSSSATNHPYISWTANGEPDITGYKIYKKITAEIGWQYKATVTTNHYEDLSESYNIFNYSHPVWYRITAIDNQNKESIASDEIQTNVNGAFLDKSLSSSESVIEDYSLSQNYPNPFNPTTTISYQVPSSCHVSLKIYDILGKEVATLVNENQEMGKYNVQFNAKNLASGMYIYQIKAGDFISSKKLLLMK